MIEIYFDNTYIDNLYYVNIKNNYEMFKETFMLGTSPCNEYEIEIHKDGYNTIPTNVNIKIDGEYVSRLIVDDYEDLENNITRFKLVDKMINLNFNYSAESLCPCTTKDILEDICSKANIILGTTSFDNDDIVVNFWDNTITAREYVEYIAELNGGYAIIDSDGKLYLKGYNSMPTIINIEECENFKIGQHHVIERVVFDNGLLKYETSNNEDLETLYLNPDNVYIYNETIFNKIAINILGFDFYSFETSNCPIDYNVRAGDLLQFNDGTNTYQTIAQYNINYNGGWIGGYNLNINSKKQEETKQTGVNTKIRSLKVDLNRVDNELQITAEEVDEQNSKISQITQTVDSLNSKISDIADITTSGESNYATFNLDNINQSEPIMIKVRPISELISYLYPNTNLYPSSNLFIKTRTIRFENTTTNEIFDYELPDDLLICNDAYDEFYLDYDSQTCQITKRCGYNANGSVYKLATERVVNYEYPSILLTDGDYTISLLGYTNGYLSVRLMASNIYTSQFATRAEVRSEINQTATEIESVVSQSYATKNDLSNATTSLESRITQTASSITQSVSDLENDVNASLELKVSKNDNNQVVSMINASADTINLNSNRLVVNSDNFKLTNNGILTCSEGNFNNTNIVGGSLHVIQDANDNSYPIVVQKTYSNGNIYRTGYHSYGITGQINGSDVFLLRNFSSKKPYFRIQDANNSNTNTIVTYEGIDNNYNGSMKLSLHSTSSGGNIEVYDSSGYVSAEMIGRTGNMYANNFIPNSRETLKKNIEVYNNALKEVINTDIYSYNFKTEKDNEKKHIGFVIGKNRNYSKDITAIRDNEEIGADLYSMISVLWRAVQEQQEEIEILKEEIKTLKERDGN